MSHLLRVVLVTLSTVSTVNAQSIFLYKGMCDASAAVAVGPHIVVANDEDNFLRLYERGKPNIVDALDVSRFLEVVSESDLEGAATIGTRIYWIGSHGNNRKGKQRPDRQRLFATDIDASRTIPVLVPVGQPYKSLRAALLEAASLQGMGLQATIDKAPEKGGLNIEGLAATPDGNGLLIGFRSPLVANKALVVSLDNPAEVVVGGKPQIGKAALLDLGGRGVRSIELVGSSYLIVAGPVDDNGTFAMYRWSGRSSDQPVLAKAVDLKGLNVEAMFVIPDAKKVQLLSDDGGIKLNGVECKDSPVAKRSFRSIVVSSSD